MKYFVIEHQIRPDDEVNTSETARSTFASALSLYYERLSKMTVTELYKSVSVMLVDQNLDVVEQKTVDTLWKEAE